MVNLTAIFRLIDEISGKLDAIANSGNSVATQLQNAGNAANGAFTNATNGGARAAQSVDGVARSAGTATSAMSGAASSADALAGNLDDIGGSADTVTQSSDELAQTSREVGAALDEAAESADYWTDAIGNYDKEAMEAIYSTEELVEAGYKTKDALEAEHRAAEEAARAVDKLGDESEETGRQGQKAGETGANAIQTLQNALVAAGVATLLKEIADGFVEAVRASIEFESAVTGVYKTVDGTAEQLASISAETKLLSTVMPATTTEIAGVAEAAGQLGIAVDDIMSFTEVMINLGEATNLSSDAAASALAKFANITGMSASNYENLGSTIVALGNSFATTEADITAMAMRMASAGTLAGLTEPEILALAASLSSVGIEADAGGSSMSTMLTKMQLAVETGNEQLEQFANVAGMTSEEFQRAWGESAVDALYAFISGLNDTERTGQTATVLLDEMGITEIRLSNAIKALAGDSDGLARAVDTANGAWADNIALSKEAELRYGTLESKLAMADNATNNLGIAFGDVLAPAVGKATEGYTTVVKDITAFIEKNPKVVAAVTGIAVAIGVVAVAITGYVVVTKLAIPAIIAFNTALTANQIGAIIMGVAALTAGVVALITVLSSGENEYDTWTASTQKQYDALQELNAEYEEACSTYGETSDEARYLAWQVDELTVSFENSKQTLEEYIEKSNSARDSLNDMLDKNRETFTEIGDNEGTTLSLIHKLEELASQTDKTVETQEEMKAIINELNETLPGLSLNYEDVIGNVENFAAAIEQTVKAQAAVQRYDAAQQGMIDAYNAKYEAENKLIELREQQRLATEHLAQAEEDYNNSWRYKTGEHAVSDVVAFYNQFWGEEKKAYDAATEALAAYDEQIETWEDTLETAQSDYDTYLDALVDYAEYANGAEEATVSYEEAVSNALTSVQADMDELIKAYDAAYEAARTNLDGTVGLFQTVEEQAGLSTEKIIEAWQSQIDFFNDYNANLKALEDIGVDPELLKELSDGSAESIAQVQALADELAGLDSTEAANTVDNINTKFGELTTAKDTAAATMAEIQTDFDTKLDEIETRLMTAVNNMNMDTEAAAAARDTMSAYIQAIKDKQDSAVSAAEAVASAVSAALSRTYTPTIGGSTGTVRGHAAGTTDAPEDVFVAGEDGPELIIGGKGSTVFPSDETNRIINAIDDRNPERQTTTTAYALPITEGSVTRVPEALSRSTDEDRDASSMTQQEKRILLEIAGRGQIEIGENVDKETIIDLLYEYLKPVLSEILKQEMYEEGEKSYAY